MQVLTTLLDIGENLHERYLCASDVECRQANWLIKTGVIIGNSLRYAILMFVSLIRPNLSFCILNFWFQNTWQLMTCPKRCCVTMLATLGSL